MSKANQFLKEEDAVSPVIGVILMVAITVILAAVIAAFVFGMGPPEQAPQASLRMTNQSTSGFTIEHQGGDKIDIGDINITVDGNMLNAGNYTNASDGIFAAGETIYVTSTVADGNTVVIIDRQSQQLIAQFTANV
ncbi:MAG: type IV pilin N-terminal domain-containing protein [Methanolobus sp.]|nr:type IV pilin N-terminal domain-containing protein [Methanolobus sp.]